MNFNKHYNLIGKHALLGASKYHWINYDDDKVANFFMKQLAVERGTRLHDLASRLIVEGIKLPKTKATFNCYVNDAIGYKMIPEQILYFSDNCFGTCDSICFRKDFLRIHDLKTGETPAHMEQLEIYAALFCLEYGINPVKIGMELRIYQSNEILVHNPTSEDITPIIEKIIRFDKIINSLKEKEMSHG